MLILIFGVLLVIAVLFSERARTTVLSSSVLFLSGGIALGATGLGWLSVSSSETLRLSSEIALFTILFVDGAQLGWGQITAAWRLPGRALLVGLPLTLAAIAAAAHWILGIAWMPAFLLGAVLSPTDPVMVRTLLEQEAVPARLRNLLSVESGLNDGLVLPPIAVLLAILGGQAAEPLRSTLEAVGGIAIGVAAAALAMIERVRWLQVSETYRPLFGIAIACTAFGVCSVTGANELLAAYSAGIALATLRSDLAQSLVRIGEPLTEAVKLAALLVFGAALSLQFDLVVIGFAAAALLAARPVALLLAFLGGGLDRKEWLTAAWFGPKGFSSILYGALILTSNVADAPRLYRIIGLVVTLSIVAHSSTDSLVARAFRRAEEKG